MKDDVQIDWKKYCLEHPGEHLPAEAQALLLRDPELKRQVDRQVAVQKLISLKRFEQPDPAALNRCLQGVESRIRQRDNSGLFARLREWLEIDAPSPAMAYGLAALLVVLVGAGVYVRGLSDDPAAPLFAETAPEIVIDEPVPVILAQSVDQPIVAQDEIEAQVTDLLSTDKPIIVLRVPPPAGAGRLQFGIEGSTPVSFDR